MTAIIGTAGWTIPRQNAGEFPAEGSSLERYAAHFAGVEINSSFHRSHRHQTWERWAASVPDSFRFAVKLPKTVTHKQKLVGCSALIDAFLEEVAALDSKLAILLVQLPPSLSFDASVAGDFLVELGCRTTARIACEPRHPTWFEPKADALLERVGAARVAADPALAPGAELPSGWPGLCYLRLHGSPQKYRSSYADGRLEGYAMMLAGASASERWCIFDNTASGAATGDALALQALLPTSEGS
jgi:uncharacterized protein YecE (DUF72 family)